MVVAKEKEPTNFGRLRTFCFVNWAMGKVLKFMLGAGDRSIKRIAVESKRLNLKRGINLRLKEELKLVEPDLKMQTMNWRQ